MSNISGKTVYDCIVVGSGAAGGWAAQELTTQGLKVLVLEAGPPIDPTKDFMSHKWPYESKYRGVLSLREQDFYPYTASAYTKHIFYSNPGHSIHETGTARMGNDPKTSVLNSFCQSHDVKNLFVVDGSSFV